MILFSFVLYWFLKLIFFKKQNYFFLRFTLALILGETLTDKRTQTLHNTLKINLIKKRQC